MCVCVCAGTGVHRRGPRMRAETAPSWLSAAKGRGNLWGDPVEKLLPVPGTRRWRDASGAGPKFCD